jgi:hypothetical protein
MERQKTEDWNNGILEEWDDRTTGMMECWNIGRLDNGRLEGWKNGKTKTWNIGIVEYWKNGTTRELE